MTLPGAHDTARNGAARFGNTWRVYRMPGWPADVYHCKAGEIPDNALIVETYPLAAPPPPAPAAQGSLF